MRTRERALCFYYYLLLFRVIYIAFLPTLVGAFFFSLSFFCPFHSFSLLILPLPNTPPPGKKGTPQAPPEYSDSTQLPSTPPPPPQPHRHLISHLCAFSVHKKIVLSLSLSVPDVVYDTTPPISLSLSLSFPLPHTCVCALSFSPLPLPSSCYSHSQLAEIIPFHPPPTPSSPTRPPPPPMQTLGRCAVAQAPAVSALARSVRWNTLPPQQLPPLSSQHPPLPKYFEVFQDHMQTYAMAPQPQPPPPLPSPLSLSLVVFTTRQSR